MGKEGKVIIISAPSGCGKSTIINAIFSDGKERDLRFSVSATNRPPRPGEEDGVNYYFLSDDSFKDAIDKDAFVEYVEVYPGRFYGTLKSEVEKLTSAGHNVLLDVDVLGGLRVKELYGDRAISIFIEPPSVDELRRRLEGRATDAPEQINQRVDRAKFELSFAPKYDCRVVNNRLEDAVAKTAHLIDSFIEK